MVRKVIRPWSSYWHPCFERLMINLLGFSKGSYSYRLLICDLVTRTSCLCWIALTLISFFSCYTASWSLEYQQANNFFTYVSFWFDPCSINSRSSFHWIFNNWCSVFIHFTCFMRQDNFDSLVNYLSPDINFTTPISQQIHFWKTLGVATFDWMTSLE